MSKTKRMLEETRGDQPIDHNKYLDDEYQYEQYKKDTERMFGPALIVSTCCKAPYNVVAEKTICTQCMKFCDVSNG